MSHGTYSGLSKMGMVLLEEEVGLVMEESRAVMRSRPIAMKASRARMKLSILDALTLLCGWWEVIASVGDVDAERDEVEEVEGAVKGRVGLLAGLIKHVSCQEGRGRERKSARSKIAWGRNANVSQEAAEVMCSAHESGDHQMDGRSISTLDRKGRLLATTKNAQQWRRVCFTPPSRVPFMLLTTVSQPRLETA